MTDLQTLARGGTAGPAAVMSRDPGAALWSRIADALRADIVAGGQRAGERIEPEHALAARFGVNRHTIRQAVRALVDEGVLRVEHGRGTFVQARGIDYPLKARTRYSEIMLASGREPRRDILGTSVISADSAAASALKVRRGARLERVETRTHIGAETFAFAVHLFARARLRGIGAIIRETGSITAALTRLGHDDYERAWTRITAELPDERLADQLARPRARPVLVTESLNVAADGTPLELGRSCFAGDLCRLTVEGDF